MKTSEVVVALAFTLYAAAFLGEIWRGTIEAIPRTQWEAATALGLRRLQTLRQIILPQAARIAIPPTVGFLVHVRGCRQRLGGNPHRADEQWLQGCVPSSGLRGAETEILLARADGGPQTS